VGSKKSNDYARQDLASRGVRQRRVRAEDDQDSRDHQGSREAPVHDHQQRVVSLDDPLLLMGHPWRLRPQSRRSRRVAVACHSQIRWTALRRCLSPDHLGKLIQDTAAYLLKQMVSGLHDLLITLSQGDDNVITHTPPGMTHQQQGVIQRHDALLVVMDWGFAAALVVTGILVILGPNSPLSYPAAGEILPRVIIGFLAAHSSLQWGGWFIDLSNALCTAVCAGGSIPARLQR